MQTVESGGIRMEQAEVIDPILKCGTHDIHVSFVLVHSFYFVNLGKDRLRDPLRRRGHQDIRHPSFPQGHCRWLHEHHDTDPVQAGHHRDGPLPLLLGHQLPPLPNPPVRICPPRLQLRPGKLRFVWIWIWSGITTTAWLR